MKLETVGLADFISGDIVSEIDSRAAPACCGLHRFRQVRLAAQYHRLHILQCHNVGQHILQQNKGEEQCEIWTDISTLFYSEGRSCSPLMQGLCETDARSVWDWCKVSVRLMPVSEQLVVVGL